MRRRSFRSEAHKSWHKRGFSIVRDGGRRRRPRKSLIATVTNAVAAFLSHFGIHL